MSKKVPFIIGALAGSRVGAASPKGLFAALAISEALTIVLAFSGNPLCCLTSFIASFLSMILGVRFGGSVAGCVVCAFLQSFFVLGILVAPGSGVTYLFLHLASLAYPVCKAFL